MALLRHVQRATRPALGRPGLFLRHLSAAADAHQHPLRVCVVGSGPAGFYATKYLLKEHAGVHVDMLEALPTPYGMCSSAYCSCWRTAK